MALGLSGAQIRYRLAIGRLHQVLPGVYSVGTPVRSHRSRALAVALFAAPAGTLGHHTAAAEHGLLPPSGPIHLISPRRFAPRRGIVFHRCRLEPDERTVRDGVPVTTVARTIVDLAALGDARATERAIREARFLRVWDSGAVAAFLDRRPRRRGAALLRRLLAEGVADLGRHRSELEVGFTELCREHGISLPESNARVEVGGRTFEVDCVWRDLRVAIELDGRQAHDTPERFESDRVRDLRLQGVGWRVGRITWAQLEQDPSGTAGHVRALLDRRSPERAA